MAFSQNVSAADDAVVFDTSPGSELHIVRGLSEVPDRNGVLALRGMELPKYTSGLLFTGSKYYKAGNRYWPFAFTPETTKQLKEDYDGVYLLLKLTDGQYLAIVPIQGRQAHTVIEVEDGVPHLVFAHLGKARLTGDFALCASAVDADPYAAGYRAWSLAMETNDYGRMRGEKDYFEAFKYLGWCSWEGFHKGITEEIILNVISGIGESGVPVTWVLLDDGHSAFSKGISPNEKFPNGYTKIKAAIDGSPVKWMGLWYSSLGVQKGGIEFPSDLGEFADYMTPQMGDGWRVAPKPTKEAMEKWWEYMLARGAGEADFVKIDFIKDIHNIYAGIQNSSHITEKREYSSVTQLCVWYREAMEEALNERGIGLMNCNGNNSPNLFFARYSNSTRCSEDYKVNRLPSAINHIYHSYHDVLWQGHIYWGDHDMFHSNDKFAGEIMAVTKAMSGGPVYLSDKPEEFEPNNIRPLCDRDGRLLRPVAPAIPSEDSLFLTPGEPALFKAFAPLSDGSVTVHVMNLREEEAELTTMIDAKDYAQGGGMVQPYLGLWEAPEEGLVVYDVLAGKGVKLDGAHEVALSKPLEHALLQLTPIDDGWALIGRADKYLCAAAGETLSCDEATLRIRLIESGPFVVYSANGAPRSSGIEFEYLGAGFYRASVEIGPERVIEITR